MDNYGEFALKRELYQNDYNLIKKLLEKGADPNQKDEFGRTCLHLGCNMAHRKDVKEVMKILVKYNADLSWLDFKQRTPLHYMFIRKNRRFEQDKFEPI
jgi:ankyrin repeat protein